MMSQIVMTSNRPKSALPYAFTEQGVAMLSGFQSIPSFNRVFHREKGMAPGEYRDLFVGDDRKNES